MKIFTRKQVEGFVGKKVVITFPRGDTITCVVKEVTSGDRLGMIAFIIMDDERSTRVCIFNAEMNRVATDITEIN